MLTLDLLKARAAELPALFMQGYSGDRRIVSVEFEPVTQIDLFYSDGDARFYLCYMTLHTESKDTKVSRRLGIYPDGTHASAYGFLDPVFGKAIERTLKELAGTSSRQ
jgi:hypothetical protein